MRFHIPNLNRSIICVLAARQEVIVLVMCWDVVIVDGKKYGPAVVLLYLLCPEAIDR